MVVWLLGFSLRKQAKLSRRMLLRKNEWKHVKSGSLGRSFLAFNGSSTYELIGRQINNIFIKNLVLSNKSTSAQISHYSPQDIFGVWLLIIWVLIINTKNFGQK
jgi:hypothetical protein